MMGWEKRKGKLYYYRKERDDQGRVQSRYMGRGDKAIEVSRADGVSIPDEVQIAVAQLESEPEIATLVEDSDAKTVQKWAQIVSQSSKRRTYRSIYDKKERETVPDWLKRARGY